MVDGAVGEAQAASRVSPIRANSDVLDMASSRLVVVAKDRGASYASPLRQRSSVVEARSSGSA
jgi:hypothetical protein